MEKFRVVYITGFMGSGKTTAGRKLAAYLKWDFIDLDEIIEGAENKKISRIFEDSGEEYFRKLESMWLRNLVFKNNTVVSVGGGAPCHSGNIDFMKGRGIIVYLRMTPEQLKARLSGKEWKRPLLRGLDSSGLLDYIRTKLEEREEWYNKADISTPGLNADIAGLAGKILQGIS